MVKKYWPFYDRFNTPDQTCQVLATSCWNAQPDRSLGQNLFLNLYSKPKFILVDQTEAKIAPLTNPFLLN